MIEREAGNGPKQEKSTISDDSTRKVATTTSWSRLKDPRIVRVSRTFGGKDRHSKVCTVRGLRDRRVRLSVPTAIQLYDLQDRLGLNQPSKVVDWLLNVAKQEIDGLPPLQFPILTPNHTFLHSSQSSKQGAAAGLKISGDFNWNDPKPPSSRVFSNDDHDPYNNNNNNNNPPSFSSLLSSSMPAPFNSWDDHPSSCLTLSQPPISLQTPQQHHQDFSHILAYQPYFPSPVFQNSSVRPPFRADLLPSQNNQQQNKHDDLPSS